MSVLSKILIHINQKPLKHFLRVSVNQNLYGIDTFEIGCRYNSFEDLDGFLIEKSKDFLGLPIVIQTRILVNDNEKDGINFRGYVTEIHSSRSAFAEDDQIIISGGSSEIALNRKPNNQAFLDKTLEEIARDVLKKYEFKSAISPRNKERFPYIVQFEESDLEFLKRLAIRYGEWCFFNGKEFVFGELPPGEKSLTLGQNLNDFSYQLRTNPVRFSLFSLDPLKLENYNYKSGNSKIESNLNLYGKHALKMSKKMYTEEGRDYYEHLNVKETDYKKGLDQVGETLEAADAVSLADLSGTSTNGYLQAGVQVKVSCLKQDGKGKFDYGKYIITSIQHVMDRSLTYENAFTAIPAETSIPENTDPYFVRTTNSHQLGMVADNKDPKKLGRVRISFWWMEGKQMTPWVKVITPLTVKNGGVYLIPPKNSRVLVGFEDGDVEKPYCLGSLFDEDAKPDEAWAGNYNDMNAKIQAVRTRSGQTIEIHDEEGAEKIMIYDAQKKKYEVVFDMANEEIQLTSTGKIKIKAAEIELSADKGITIQAGKDLKQEGSNIKIEAKSNLEGSGTNVEMKAQASFKAEGNASSEVSSSGTTAVKGSLVQIN